MATDVKPRDRFVVWDKEGRFGTEAVDVTLHADRLTARGVALGWEPLPYRLEFSIETGASWITSHLAVTTAGEGWRRHLDLRRSAEGRWSVDAGSDGLVDLPPSGGDPAAFADALDCDLGLCPLTNTMPVLRHDLLRHDASLDFVMAWVSVPDLAVRRSEQRYTTRGRGPDGLPRIEYRSIGSTFVAELTFDADGLVVDYPQLGRRPA
jgi:uncharacterized protein